MTEINNYQLLSDTIDDNQGNTSNQTDAVANLFLNGLFDSTFLKCFQLENGDYQIEYGDYVRVNKTPSLALAELIDDMYMCLSGYKYGSV